jgi:GAF domain-containing protein
LGEHADRWPAYVRHAETIGVQAVASVPMATHDIAGTLDLYERRPHVWSRDELAIAALLAVMAGTFLSNVTALERAQGEIAQLQIALDSRVLIEQAKGIIAATHSISIDRAFERLRKHARDHKAPLHTVAAAVVNLGLRP